MNYDRCFFFARAWDLHQKNCFAHCMILLLNNGGKTSKHNVVWTAPFWIIVDTFTASHVRKNVNRFPTYLLEWLVTCGKCWPSPFCCLIFLSNHKQKTHHQKPTSKTKCCLNSTLLNHSGHFYSTPWKNVNRFPTYLLEWLVTCGKCWPSPFCCLIFLSNHKQKTHHQKPTSKTKCCLNSTLLNHSGHFYSIPRKKFEQIPPPIFF